MVVVVVVVVEMMVVQKKEEQEEEDVIEPSFVPKALKVLERKLKLQLEQESGLELVRAPSALSVSSRRAAPGGGWQSDSPGPAHSGSPPPYFH